MLNLRFHIPWRCSLNKSRGSDKEPWKFPYSFLLLLLDFLLLFWWRGVVLSLHFSGLLLQKKRVLNVKGSINVRSQLNSGRMAVNRMEYPPVSRGHYDMDRYLSDANINGGMRVPFRILNCRLGCQWWLCRFLAANMSSNYAHS